MLKMNRTGIVIFSQNVKSPTILGRLNNVFKQGVTLQGIKNTTSYEGDSFSADVSIGNICR